MICKWCGKSFNREEADEEFTIECSGYSYENFQVYLCADCAIEAVKDRVDGVYLETCEECGVSFDPFDTPWNRTLEDIRDYWTDRILCWECIETELENEGE